MSSEFHRLLECLAAEYDRLLDSYTALCPNDKALAPKSCVLVAKPEDVSFPDGLVQPLRARRLLPFQGVISEFQFGEPSFEPHHSNAPVGPMIGFLGANREQSGSLEFERGKSPDQLYEVDWTADQLHRSPERCVECVPNGPRDDLPERSLHTDGPGVAQVLLEQVGTSDLSTVNNLGSNPWKVFAPLLSTINAKSTPRLELHSLDLVELCDSNHPGRAWTQLSIKEQVELIRSGLQARHLLLDPNTSFMRTWDMLISIALGFTAIVTPYEVCFSSSFTEVVTVVMWWINRFFDMLFVVDMVMNFFLKVEVKSSHGYGNVMLRDPKLIRWNYLTGWFWIDLFSIIPVDYVLMANSVPQSLQNVKMLRCLRTLRLIKLVRIVRASRMAMRWQNHFTITFSTQKLIKFLVILLISSHWMACLWGLVGLTYAPQICDLQGSQTVYSAAPSQVSWITALFFEGKTTPDDICNHFHLYMVALHFSVMTITSIGYGDVVPQRFEEYTIGVICQFFGSVIWAYVIGCACAILSRGDPVQEHFEANTDLLNQVMREARVPYTGRAALREYLRESRVHNKMCQFADLAHRCSPLMRGFLMVHMSERWITKISYFKDAPQAFVVDVAERLGSRFYARRERMSDTRHQLGIVDRGAIAHGGYILTNGSVFQKDMIIQSTNLHEIRATVSLTYCRVLLLSRADLAALLGRHAKFAKKVHWAAMKLALHRVLLLCVQKSLELRSKAHAQAHSLTYCFRALDIHVVHEDAQQDAVLSNVFHSKGLALSHVAIDMDDASSAAHA